VLRTGKTKKEPPLFINKGVLPAHIAIIMDGNGRWAERRGLSRSEGHREGAKVLDSLFSTLLELNIPFVSLFAFSTENWKRPKTEVDTLFKILNFYLKKKIDLMVKNDIRLHVSGDISRLPRISQELIELALKKTGDCKKLTVNFCINYGGRDELINAFNSLLQEKLSEGVESKITSEDIEKKLYTHPMPDVDLLIRTAGEKRLSNFLLYQSAYAELYFTELFWPDFDEHELYKSLIEYQKRVRKFGGLKKSLTSKVDVK